MLTFDFMTDENGTQTTIATLLKDPVVFPAKIPLEKLRENTLLGKGGYGEVYKGTYGEQTVAIKRLSESHRSSVQHIEGLLVEVKLMVTMVHPNIVRFVGVAWDALTDLCIVIEFMAGRDLRDLLVQYKKSGHSRDLNNDHVEKLRIAKDIANGLTYLHSLDPMVIHRDLKSRNVLLSETLEAKLTDSGISREQSDATMTAGIGTSLWMAPEVITGGHYDEKADIFSFVVVLSELDTLEAPYADFAVDASGRHITEASLLSQVANGTIQASFSPAT